MSGKSFNEYQGRPEFNTVDLSSSLSVAEAWFLASATLRQRGGFG
ncbi:MAG TPA: hypothetical protein VIF37_10090 [Methylobacter sp.]